MKIVERQGTDRSRRSRWKERDLIWSYIDSTWFCRIQGQICKRERDLRWSIGVVVVFIFFYSRSSSCFLKDLFHEQSNKQKQAMKFSSLLLAHISETTDSWSNGGGSRGGINVGTTSHRLLTRTTFPDANTGSLHVVFATERTRVFRMLCHFHFLHHFTKWSTVTRQKHQDEIARSRDERDIYRVPYLPTMPTFLVRLAMD